MGYLTLPDFVPHNFTGLGQVREYFEDPERLNFVMAWVGAGKPITKLAELIGFRYVDLYRILTSEQRADYLAARAAHSERLAEKNLAMADDVESLNTPADAANAASKIRQWHMEKATPEQWGKHSTVDMNVKGVVGLHMDAIRMLADEPLEGEFEEVEEAPHIKEDIGDDDDDEFDDHPLL